MFGYRKFFYLTVRENHEEYVCDFDRDICKSPSYVLIQLFLKSITYVQHNFLKNLQIYML